MKVWQVAFTYLAWPEMRLLVTVDEDTSFDEIVIKAKVALSEQPNRSGTDPIDVASNAEVLKIQYMGVGVL